MPTHFKVLISILALLVTTTVFYLDSQAEPGGIVRWVTLGLGPLMVFAIWVFPEAKAKEIRKEAATRRE